MKLFPDYFIIDDLLSNEQKIIRESIREWVNRSVIPIIDKAAQDHVFPKHLIRDGRNWCIWTIYSRKIWGCWT